VALAVALVSCTGVACGWNDPPQSQVDPLVVSRATRQEVAAKLGPGYTWYGAGADGGLADFLAREPAEQYKPVREAIRSGRRIMFYTTAWQQTWLFFDESERLVGYWFNTQ
jgi:hypothetical protein